jgi:hypothetical protein
MTYLSVGMLLAYPVGAAAVPASTARIAFRAFRLGTEVFDTIKVNRELPWYSKKESRHPTRDRRLGRQGACS